MDRLDKFIDICVEWLSKSDIKHVTPELLKDKKRLNKFFQTRKTALENKEKEEWDKLSNMDKLAEEVYKIPGASVWDKNPNKKDDFDFVELRIYDGSEIGQVYELLEKYDFKVESETDSFGSDYDCYIIKFSPKVIKKKIKNPSN